MGENRFLDFISGSAWFDGAPEAVVVRLAHAATLKHYDAGEFVWTSGQQNPDIYGLITGRLRISMPSSAGTEFALIDWEAGAWLGEQILGPNQPNMLEVQALETSDLLAIPRPVVLAAGEAWPQLYRNLYHSNWDNTRGLYEILSAVLFYPLKARVAGRVLALMSDHGRRVDGGVLLDIKLSQNDFARLAMGSRQRVNRIFRDWQKLGLLDYRDDHLLIIDSKALQDELEPFE